MDLPTIIRRKASLIYDAASAVAHGEILPLSLNADIALLQVDGGNATAGGTLTLAANVANDETVTIGLITYTFKTTLSSPAVPNEVLIGATASDSIDNLIAAINRDNGEGTLYSEGTGHNYGEGKIGPHPDVTAAQGAGDTMDVTARIPGTGPNSVATTETLAQVGSQWGGATLTGGTDFTGTLDFLGTVDGLRWFAVEGESVAAKATVATAATAVGQWRLNVEGLTGLRFPISALTAGTISARIIHGPKTQG